MNMPHPHRFWSPGPAEYSLGKVGLFNVIDTKVSPARRLARLLDPLPDELLPPLVEMAEICSLELGGAIDTYARRGRRSLRPEKGLACRMTLSDTCLSWSRKARWRLRRNGEGKDHFWRRKDTLRKCHRPASG